MGLGANSTTGVAATQTTSNMVVGPGSGTSNQSCVTASPHRPLNHYAGYGGGAKSQNHSGRGDIGSDVTQRYTWSTDHSGHSAELTRNTSTMRPLSDHHSSESRKTLHHVLPQNQIANRTTRRGWEAMAPRIKNEKTFSGHIATGGSHTQYTVNQPTAHTLGQLYHLKQCQASHPI
jgi:hypothetical protein